ncbi:hypothetical protein [Jonquetella anthropi]|uniref:hypothetical protein n=1 Tax=Jonquetella anthropi TaxID=428712 RepID=UPI0023F4EAB6|nr:hypothetical protein [Jonquetella anthropi]
MSRKRFEPRKNVGLTGDMEFVLGMNNITSTDEADAALKKEVAKPVMPPMPSLPKVGGVKELIMYLSMYDSSPKILKVSLIGMALVIRELYDNHEDTFLITQSTLSQRFQMHPASVKRHLSELEKLGLIDILMSDRKGTVIKWQWTWTENLI